VKALVAEPIETKYVASTVRASGGTPAFAFGVLQQIISGTAVQQAWNLLPDLAQGVEGHQRIGNRISDVTLKSSWQFYINPNLAGNPTVDATVKVFILKSKTAKSFDALSAVQADSLLDAGNGSSIDWLPPNPTQAKYLDTFPVNKEQFKVLKIHKFRLCKNQDSPTNGTGSAATPNMTAHQSKDFVHTYTKKGVVSYPDSTLTGSLQPTNLTYFAYVVMYDTNAFTGLPFGTILCNARAQMYYKDG